MSANAQIPLACRLDVFQPDERARHIALLESLRASVREVIESPGGFRFRLDDAPETLVRAAEWITLERRCCPFFRFEMVASAEGTWLELGAPVEARAMIRSVLAP